MNSAEAYPSQPPAYYQYPPPGHNQQQFQSNGQRQQPQQQQQFNGNQYSGHYASPGGQPNHNQWHYAQQTAYQQSNVAQWNGHDSRNYSTGYAQGQPSQMSNGSPSMSYSNYNGTNGYQEQVWDSNGRSGYSNQQHYSQAQTANQVIPQSDNYSGQSANYNGQVRMAPPQYGYAPPAVAQQPVAIPPPPIKNGVIFPPNCVEATQPNYRRTRRLRARDIAQVQVSRLLMCLKSGLLAESTWALDVLSVLIHDDASVMAFALNRRPGLLGLLLGHYGKYLAEIFGGVFEDIDQCLREDFQDDTSHIVTHLDSKAKKVRFALKDKTSEVNNYNLIKDSNQETKEESVEVKTEQEDCDLDFAPLGSRKRKRDSFEELDDEAFHKDEPPLVAVDDYYDALARRCLCLSTLIRNLSFIQGNDVIMSKNQKLVRILSHALLLNHEHSSRKIVTKGRTLSDIECLLNDDEECKTLNCVNCHPPSCETDSGQVLFGSGEREWFKNCVNLLLDNSLVTIANISGQLNVAAFPEDISLPLLDGLLHWAVCPSSFAQDHLPTTSLVTLSPRRLALEALVKFSIHESNVDLILATPPWSRLHQLFKQLAKQLGRHEDQTLREFALVLMVNLASADSGIARAIAMTGSAIPQLISFVEQSEQSAMSVANSHGLSALRTNPELMGTTLDMVRRAANCLRLMARMVENRSLFNPFQTRMLSLAMSQILDQRVAAIIADVIFETTIGGHHEVDGN